MMSLARSIARGPGAMARGAVNLSKTRRGKFGIGVGVGLGGLAALRGRSRGRSSGTNGLQSRSSGGAQQM